MHVTQCLLARDSLVHPLKLLLDSLSLEIKTVATWLGFQASWVEISFAGHLLPCFLLSAGIEQEAGTIAN